MTVTATVPLSGPYVADGVNRAWDFGFKITAASDINLVLTDADGVETTITSGFTVPAEDIGQNDGGTVTYPIAPVAALLAPIEVRVTRKVALGQPNKIGNQGNFFPLTHEETMDLLAMQIQDQSEKLGRALVIPVSADPSELDTVVAGVILLSGIAADITAVAAIDTEVVLVAGGLADVTTVAANMASVVTVAGIAANVTTVAGIAADVTTVAGLAASIAAVVGISADVTTVAGIAANVTAVAAIDTEIAAVVANLTDVQNAAENALLAKAWATNPEDDDVEPGLFSAFHWAQKAEGFAGVFLSVQDQINAAADTAFADADMLTARKAADGSLIKRSWLNVKALLKTYFDTLYPAIVGTTVDNRVVRWNGTTGQQQDSLVTIDDLGNLNVGLGTVGAPAISFGADTNSGFWEDSDGRISIAVNGAYVGYWNNVGFTATAQAPTVAATFGTVAAAKMIHGGGGQIDVTNTTGGASLRLSRGLATDGTVASFHRETASVGTISVTSAATAYNTSSDYRLKYDVVPLVEFTLDAEDFAMLGASLSRLMLLQPVSHKWLIDPDLPAVHGFIAHDLQAITPNAVSGEKDEVEDYGTAIVPARTVPGRVIRKATRLRKEKRGPDVVVPAEIIEDILEREAPAGSTWTKVGERPVYQGIDTSFLLADAVASIQELTLMVIKLQNRLNAAGL